jgi:hypothetical protein
LRSGVDAGVVIEEVGLIGDAGDGGNRFEGGNHFGIGGTNGRWGLKTVVGFLFADPAGGPLKNVERGLWGFRFEDGPRGKEVALGVDVAGDVSVLDGKALGGCEIWLKSPGW